MVEIYSTGLNTWIPIVLFGGGSLVWAAIVGGIIFAPRDRGPGAQWEPRSPEEDQLLRRFARGEIDDDEYRTRRGALRNAGAAQPEQRPVTHR